MTPDVSIGWLMVAIAVWAVVGTAITLACLCVPYLLRWAMDEARTWLRPQYVIKAQRHNAQRIAPVDDRRRRQHLDALVDFSQWQQTRRLR